MTDQFWVKIVKPPSETGSIESPRLPNPNDDLGEVLIPCLNCDGKEVAIVSKEVDGRPAVACQCMRCGEPIEWRMESRVKPLIGNGFPPLPHKPIDPRIIHDGRENGYQ